MKVLKSSLTLIIVASLLSCSGMKTVKSTTQIPPGIKVDYEKLTNPAYAQDYIGADVITEVEFYAAKLSNSWQTKIPKDHIVFQVIPVGGQAKDSPFGGGSLGDYVFIPKSKGDIVFELKPGDRIELRGGTRVRKSIIVNNVSVVEFVATDMRKL